MNYIESHQTISFCDFWVCNDRRVLPYFIVFVFDMFVCKPFEGILCYAIVFIFFVTQNVRNRHHNFYSKIYRCYFTKVVFEFNAFDFLLCHFYKAIHDSLLISCEIILCSSQYVRLEHLLVFFDSSCHKCCFF